MTNNLPSGWVWTRLEDLVAHEPRAITDGPFGSNLKTVHYTDDGPRVIRLQNIGDGVYRHEDAHISEEHYRSLVQHSVREGDLVVASLGDALPRACLVPSWVPPAIVKADCIRVRLHPDLDPSYINFALQRPELRRETAAHIKGVGRPRLGLRGIKDLVVPLAPPPEQERIVAAIEEHFTRLDAVELALQRALQQLDTLKSAVLVEAFHSNRGLPSHWNWTTIGEVAEVKGGIQKQPKRRPNKNPAPFLRVANVLRGELLLDEVHQIELFDGELQRYRLQAGDLLVVEGNGSPQQIGRAACWEGEIADCVHQNHLIRVRPGPKLVPRYLALYWNAPRTASVLREVASSTSGLYTLSTAKVKSIPIPVAPLPEQQRIAEEVDQQLEAHTRLEQSIRHAHDRLRAVRRSILALAFSGQLMAQDPDDEPASVLLERIAASRRATPTRQDVNA
ncbi:MAG: restriction endonuclease subunit S [Acidimicrobiaceae bacterium]|nr:restriction endonuclease subunit S [Acidimicrobiaceae bacterium]